jgi:hypothetical protein
MNRKILGALVVFVMLSLTLIASGCLSNTQQYCIDDCEDAGGSRWSYEPPTMFTNANCYCVIGTQTQQLW